MLKMTIDNEEVVSDKDITINEEMLSASSSILNNVYPKEWEEDKDYTSKFYYPQDYSKALIQRSYVTQEAEAGTTIQVNGSVTLTDVDTTKNSRVLRLLGQTSQNGTPTPSSPIPVNVVSGDNEIVVCGKNICFTDFGDWESGEYNSSGNKANSTSRVRTKDLLIVRQSTTYFLDTSSSNDSFIVREYDKNKTFIKNDGIIANGGTITTMSNCYFLGITLFSNTNQTRSYDIYQTLFEESSIKPFICLNSVSNKTYEPYIGNTYNIDLPVENLLSLANVSDYTSLGVTHTINGEAVTLNGTTTGAGNIIAKTSTGITLKAGTYTGSITTSGSYNRPSGDVAFYLRKKNTVLGMFGIPLTNMATDGQYSSSFILTEDTEIFLEIYASASNISFNNYTCKFQIEKGLKANTYTPYGTTPIELCKIGNYQDYFYKDSGKLYLHKEIGKVVLNGSENIAREPIQNNHYKFYLQNISNVDYGDINYIPKILCDKLIAIGRTTMYVNTQGISSSNGALQIYTDDTKDMTISEFRTWLGSNNLIVYYGLITPTTTEITYQPLISQLNALSSQ